MSPSFSSWYHFILTAGTAVTSSVAILAVYHYYFHCGPRNSSNAFPWQSRQVQLCTTPSTKCVSDDTVSDVEDKPEEEVVQTIITPRGSDSSSGALLQTLDGLCLKNLSSVRDLSKADLECIMKLSSRCRTLVRTRGHVEVLTDKIIASLFYEPSTRTRCSFEAAIKRLGGSVVAMHDVANSSSVSKGETLEDTVRMLSMYCDCIIIRHPEKGSAERAMSSASVPIINAGDGIGEHPTQALLDFFTISSFFPKLLSSCAADITNVKGDTSISSSSSSSSASPLRIAFVGDLVHGRTVHSLSRFLALYNVEFYYVAPNHLQFPKDLEAEISLTQLSQGYGKNWRQVHCSDIKDVLPFCDVIYMTRIQKERFSSLTEYESVKDSYILTSALLEEYSPAHAKVLHPLPRLNEIAKDVDLNKRQAYFQQAQNGLYVRMAILSAIMGQARKIF